MFAIRMMFLLLREMRTHRIVSGPATPNPEQATVELSQALLTAG